jgi:hypothetical protein
VPNLLRDTKGRLIAVFQWFPADRPDAFDRIAVRFSKDHGRTWSSPQPITLKNYPPSYHRPCDPTLAQLADGRFRLYYTADPGDGKGATTCSALSPDGINFTHEDGIRFRDRGVNVLDCSVAKLGKTWHYYAPIAEASGKGYHATSPDGLNFTRQADVEVDGPRRWLGCAVPVKGGLRFYGTANWTAFSPDGTTWKLEAAKFSGADPGAAQNKNGRWFLISTGPARSDAARGPNDPGTVAASDEYIYILRGGVVYQYDARTFRLVRQQRLPARQE